MKTEDVRPDELGSKNILLVTPDYPPPPGGIQTIVQNLERGLQEIGHDTSVLHVDPTSHPYKLSDYIPSSQWSYSVKATLTAQFRYLNAVERRTRQAIEKYNPDVIHAMHIRCWPALVLADKYNIPSVLSTYALELEDKPLAANAIGDADRIHAISDFTGSLVEDIARDAPQVSIIPPSIDVQTYQESATDITKDGTITTLARFVDRKNLETVIRAWDQLPDQIKSGRELVIAGDGPNRDTLERMAGDRNNITFPGWVNGKEKRQLLAQSDAFVMVPRRNRYDVEGFGIVYIEAQATGTPVIGSRHGGAPEAIDDAGLIVDNEDDPSEVANAMVTLLTDEDVRNRCLSAAQDRINRFDIPEIANRFETVYGEVIKTRE